MIMVSERIKRLREKKGLTQKQLAEIIRVDQSTVALSVDDMDVLRKIISMNNTERGRNNGENK